MDKFYLAIFTEKSTGRTLYRLNQRPLNKFFWEKAKAEVVDRLVKDRFFVKEEIAIEDLGPQR